MAETKYGKYIMNVPLAENKYPPYTPKVSYESKDNFPQLNFSFSYTYLNQPITMETVHTHDFGQFLCFMGTPEDLKVFDGEVYINLGEEGTQKAINATSVVYIPKGLVHGPIIWDRVDKPMMLLNCKLSSEYSRTEVNIEGRTAGTGSADATKYNDYIIKEPFSWNVLPPYGARFLFDSHNYFPETNLGVRYTYLNQALDMERPHSHPFDQLISSIGPPHDIRLYDGAGKFWIGEEGEEHASENTPHITYIPAGLIHGPSSHSRMNTPTMMINFIFASQYTRNDQQTGFLNYLELTAKRINPDEASGVLGAALPRPDYLPEGYQIREIYKQDDWLRLLISDNPIVQDKIKLGDATGARERYRFTCQMEMAVRWYPDGKPEGLDVRGEDITVGEVKGILIYRESNLELRWLLPSQSTPGQYEIALKASQNNKDELLKVAQSLK
jgi:hypothetical protein